MSDIFLTEFKKDHTCIWKCEPPVTGRSFQVTEQSWAEPEGRPPVRTITAWHYVDA